MQPTTLKRYQTRVRNFYQHRCGEADPSSAQICAALLDVIIELPAELLDKLGWSVGDQLVVEKTDDLLPLKLKPRTSRTVQTDP